MEYTGRGMLQGIGESQDEVVQAFWICGRSKSSQRRLFRNVSGEVCVMPLVQKEHNDRSILNSNLYYTAMTNKGNSYIVGNGPQVEMVRDRIEGSDINLDIGRITRYAPPDKIETPRLTGSINLYNKHGGTIGTEVTFSLVKPLASKGIASSLWRYENLAAGIGYLITTYDGNARVLSPFRGEPLLVEITNSGRQILEEIWHALNPDNRVCLVVRIISTSCRDIKTYMCSRHYCRIIEEYEAGMND